MEAAKRNKKAVRPFVLCSFRHTFLARLGESGCDVWILARIAGHKIGHRQNQAPQLSVAKQTTNAVQ